MSDARSLLLRVMTEEGPRYGVVVAEHVYCLEGDPFGDWEPGDRMGLLIELALLAPSVPTKIICVGLNYPAHADESSVAVPSEPLLFLKPPSAVIGPEAAILLPPQSERVDYEAELGIVIGRVMGRSCRNVRRDEAWDHVLGVTCGNDVTARDLQQLDDQLTRPKGFDTFCPLGPWLVAGLGEEDVSDLEVACRVNGRLRQAGRTSNMTFSPTELIAYASSIMTLEPGDVIMTGTPEGVGPLVSGDIVEVEVGGIGVLRNPVRRAALQRG